MTYRIRAMWADAVRYGQWEEADRLWKLLMIEWLTPKPDPDQKYWNDLLDRRMGVLERKEQRSKINDDEWDRRHGDVNQ